jgi:hypothetical protein
MLISSEGLMVSGGDHGAKLATGSVEANPAGGWLTLGLGSQASRNGEFSMPTRVRHEYQLLLNM